MKQGTQTREKENKTRTGVTGLCHKTMNKLEQSTPDTLCIFLCAKKKSANKKLKDYIRKYVMFLYVFLFEALKLI